MKIKIHKSLVVIALSLISFFSCGNKIKQTQSAEIPEVMVRPFPKTTVLKDSFPTSWFGTWEGTLNIYNAKGLSQSIPMSLELGATDTLGRYKWHIIYGADRAKGLRPYYLKTIDASKGQYLNDEMNSIKMEAYLLGGKLFSTFSVEGNLLTSMQEKVGDTMLWEIVFGKEKEVSITGNQVVKGDTISAVKTMPVIISQRAVLKKKKS
jgi:hypothetical protein